MPLPADPAAFAVRFSSGPLLLQLTNVEVLEVELMALQRAVATSVVLDGDEPEFP
jgi:hypothetical protein